jgi:cytidine deaminase
MALTSQQRRSLFDAALNARRNAYAPFSRFTVGAALIDATGMIHVGCNVENASYGLTVCAERVALLSAVASGRQGFLGLAVAAAEGPTPCGACRQVLAEFCQDLPIWLIDAQRPDRVVETSLQELLPLRFGYSPDNP